MSSSTYATDQPRVLSDLVPGDRVRDLLLTVGFAGAIAVAAQLKLFLPGNPVPISAQTFVVLVGAIALGARRATAGATLFLGVGLAGVPWFTSASGATLGYIVGFVAASALLGTLAQRGLARTVGQVALAMFAGNVVIVGLGATWLGIVTGQGTSFAVANGVVPFLLGDAIKLAAAVAVLPTVWKLVDRR